MSNLPEVETYSEMLARSRREYLTHVMKLANGNVQLGAEIAGVNRTYFFRALSKWAPDAPRQGKKFHPRDLKAWHRKAVRNLRYATERRMLERYRNEGNAAWRALG